MVDLQQVGIQLSEGRFQFSRPAFRRVVERNISRQEIRQAGLKAMIIEDYPADNYSPSCLKAISLSLTPTPIILTPVGIQSPFCHIT